MRTQSGAIVNKLLTNVSNGYFPGSEMYLAETILPSISVPQTTGLVGNYSNNHLRIVNTVHEGKGPYRQLESITVGSNMYNIEDHGLHDIITPKQLANFEAPFDAEQDTTLALTLAHYNAKEFGLATALQDPAVITQGKTLTGNARYSQISHDDSNPIEDNIEAHNAIRDATGMRANVAIMGGKTFDYMSRHHRLLDALGFTSLPEGGLSREALARVLNVERVLVGEAMYNASKQGQADDLRSHWGTDVVYARIGAPALRQKVLGFEFRLNGTSPRQTFRFTPNMPVNSRGIIVTDNYDQMILNAGAAYLIQDAGDDT